MTNPEPLQSKRRLWPWITLVVIIILLGGLRLAMRSDSVLDYVRSQAETRVSEMLDGEVHIGRIQGDLWRYLDVQDISVYDSRSSDPANPLITLDSLHIAWSIFDLIFKRPLEVKKLHAHGFHADLVQDEQGLWNVLALLPDEEAARPDEPPDEAGEEDHVERDGNEKDTETEDAEEEDPFRFVLGDVKLTAPAISVDARAILPGEPLTIRDLELHTRLGRDERGLFSDIHKLELSVHESRLDAPVQMQSEASWDGRRITLDKLLVTGAYTLLETSGSYDTVTSSTELQALLDPLSWREAEAYLEEYPIRQDLDVSLHVGGSRQDLRTDLMVNAPGLEDFNIKTRWSILQEPVLTAFSLNSGRVDVAELTGKGKSPGSMASGGDADSASRSGNVSPGNATFGNASAENVSPGNATSANASAENASPGNTSDTRSGMRNDLPLVSAGGISLEFEGAVPLFEWDRVRLAGKASIRDIAFEAYSLDALELDLDAEPGSVQSDLVLRKGDESVAMNLQASQWWDEQIDWQLAWSTDGIDPAHWSGLEELSGEFIAEGSVSGSGYAPGGQTLNEEISTGHSPDGKSWTMTTEINRLMLSGYPELTAVISGEITSDTLQLQTFAEAAGAELQVSAGMLRETEQHRYEAEVAFSNVDVSAFPGLEDLPTRINGSVSANGEGFDPETMMLDAVIALDDFEINRESFEQLQLDFKLRNGIAYVEEGYLRSIPATAQLSMRQNIFDFRDPQNRLDFDMELLDIRGFAALAGADSLQAKGRLIGTIHSNTAGELVLESSLNLHELQYDTVRVEQLNGSAWASLTGETEYRADLDMRSPSVGEYKIRDISLITDGRITDTGMAGMYDFEFNIENESGFLQRADYEIVDEEIRVRIHEMHLSDPAGVYRLHQPFDVRVGESRVQIDTLRMVSGRGSELSLALEKYPESPWTGYLDANDADLGQLQYIFLDEPIFHALFTGRLGFLIDEDTLEVDARSDITGFRYDHLELDSIHLAFDLADRRLVTDATVRHAGKEQLRSEFDLPIELLNPDDLDDMFFEEEVSGYIKVDTLNLSLFEETLKAAGLEQITGDISLFTTLSGVAGVPEMTGEMRLSDGTLSGVAIDTLLMTWDYNHSRNDLELTSRIHSLGQKAAEISSRFPLHLDFREFEFDGPDPEDPLNISVYTDAFNLAAFNDFINPARFENLQGLLDADVDIQGTINDPEMEGAITLSGGQLRLVENNVTFRQIRADVELTPDHIALNSLSVQSAGSFGGEGTITLDGLIPDELDLRFTAGNFRVSNTRDLELFMGLDVTLSGNLEEPELTGDVRWERGTLFIDDFGERGVEEVVLEEEMADAEQRDTPDFFERLTLEINFSVDRNAYLRNRREPAINLALRGEIVLIKGPFGDLQVFGNMGVSSGHVTTFNKRFQLERGDITFSGDPVDPELDIRTLYEPRQQYEDIRIYYLITGTVSDPQFEYESEPEMELQDIISYTLFGRPFHALAGWEQTVSGRSDGSMATHIAVDVLLDRIETLAADRIGIDVIEIENTRQSGGGGTIIKAGKFISDRLFIAFLQEMGGSKAGRQVVVEYILRRNLELIITAGDDYRSGVDMLWRYDY